MQWDLVCPDCRRPPKRAQQLSGVVGQQHCDTCAITFGVNFDRSVEVTFRPSPRIRAVDDQVYCFTNPGQAVHVVAQATVAPATVWEVALVLEPGLHRLRARRTPGSLLLEARPDGPAEVTIELDPQATEAQPVLVRSGPEGAKLRVRLGGTVPRLVLVEQTAWMEDAACAADVTSLQSFRQLFPGEAVAAGERIEVRKLAFLFTDLKDSTALYERVGDGPAYGAVSEHFRILEEAIAAEAGGVVKTIGDAVMAVFPDAGHATRAALRIQRDIAAWNAKRPGGPLLVKAGLTEGPCVAVNANHVLDYFGTTVNVAARVQALSVGGDLVLPTEIAREPEVAAALGALPSERFSAALKGLSKEVEVLRVLVDPGAAAKATGT
jgi:class 3 adenylate cyclase